MKNLHLLPTDKPSRLHVDLRSTFLTPNYQIGKEINSVVDSINIYITSDEEIKEDYVIAYGVVIKVMMFDKETLYFINGTKAKREDCKKIILTTDQYLIKDGVQVIDDEFLEWFVKNPTCEEVETVFNNRGITGAEKILKTFGEYKIIIPKEEAMNMKEEFEKSVNIIDDWLEKNGDPEIHKQVEQEAKELCEQNKISEEELERVISAPINLYSVIKYLFNKFKKIRYVR